MGEGCIKDPSFGAQGSLHFKVPLFLSVRSVNHGPAAPLDIIDQNIQASEMGDDFLDKRRYFVGLDQVGAQENLIVGLHLGFLVIGGLFGILFHGGHHLAHAIAGITVDAATSANLVAWTGPEEAGNDSSMRYGVDAVVNRRVGPRATAWVQADYGREDANPALPDPTRNAQWWGIGAWVKYDVLPSADLAVRADYLDDEGGARTSGVLGLPANLGQRLGSGTITLNIHAWSGAMVRPEVRYDRSSLAAFGGKRGQWTGGLSVADVF